MNKHVRNIVFTSTLSLLLFTYAPLALAAVGAIGGTPAYPREDNRRTKSIFIETLKPGEVSNQGIRVNNYTKETKTVVIGAVDSIAATDGSFSCKQDAEKQKAVGTWVKLKTKEVTIAPDSNQVVDFTVTVPEGQSPGEHNGCITLRDKGDTGSKSGSGVLLSFRTATRLSVTVPGKIIKALSLKEIKVARLKTGNYTVSPVVHNTGNVSLDTASRVQLVSVFGHKSPIKLANFPVMAGATTGWNFEFKRPFWGGVYKAQTSISYNADPTAGLGEHVNDAKKVRKDTGYFYMLPAWPAAAVEVAVPLFIVFAIFMLLHRKRRKRQVRTKWQQYSVKQGDTVASLAEERKTNWKRIVKVNNLKAPFLLQPGQQILVPPLSKQPDDWLVEETPVHTQLTEAVQVPAQKLTAPVPPSGPVRVSAPGPPTPHAVPVPTTWASPRDDTHDSAAYDEYGEPIPDWREGADDEEIEKIEHIDGANFASQYRTEWEEVDKKPTKDTSTSKKRSKPARKKKTPKKAP